MNKTFCPEKNLSYFLVRDNIMTQKPGKRNIYHQ